LTDPFDFLFDKEVKNHFMDQVSDIFDFFRKDEEDQPIVKEVYDQFKDAPEIVVGQS